MPITQEQRSRRRERIGSSDSPAILGVDPFKSAHDVYLSKVADMGDIDSEAIDLGNRFEEPMLDWAAKELGVEIEKNVSIDGELPFAANLDARAIGQRFALEAKSTSLSDQYGVEGTDQVPDRVIVQCCHQMMVDPGLDAVWVPVLMAKFDRLQRKLYRVDRNPDIIEHIRRRGLEFWNRVLGKNPPADEVPSIDTIRRIHRIPATRADISPDLVEAFELARKARKEAETAEDEAKRALLAAMGTAEGADYGDPRFCYTFLQQTRTSIDTKALRAAHPAIAQEFSRVSRFRVLRRKKLS